MDSTLAKGVRVDRRFAMVGEQHIHYRRCGTGPPIILVHPAITSGVYFIPQMKRLAARYTCFAFDNPGFGSSDPTPGSRGTMSELADGIAAAMDVLGFPAVPVFGYHTGAAVALELAVRRPDLVSGLVLDGLPIFTADEVDKLFSSDFAPPLEIDPLGGHLTRTWTRFRDQAMFYPWCVKTPETVLSRDNAASPQGIDDWVKYFYYSADHYAVPFRDAHDFGSVAAERIGQLVVPATFVIASNDFLIAHVGRMPAIRPNQWLVRIGPGAEEKAEVLDTWFTRFGTQEPAPSDARLQAGSEGIEKHYVDLDSGQMLVRSCGPAGELAVVILHDAPGSGMAHESLVRAMGRELRVHVLDLPGCGESDPLPEGARTLADYAEAVRLGCAAIGTSSAVVYGIGFGASVAIELARQDANAPPNPHQLVTCLILRGVLLPSADERNDLLLNFAPPIEIGAHGEHWYRVWLMLRDSLIYWPWYRRGGAGLRRVTADFGGERLHRWTFEVVKQLGAYHHVIDAALRHDAASALSCVRVPALVLKDCLHPFAVYDSAHAAITSGMPNIASEILPPDDDQEAEMVVRFAKSK